MTVENLTNDSPATDLFPQFEEKLYRMICTEVEGLTQEQLDFESDRWEWSKWSIRRNVSHMASGDVRWFWQRWGATLFPDGLPNGAEYDDIMDSPHDRRLDEDKYWDLDVILEKMVVGLALAWKILSEETVGSLRGKELDGSVGGLFSRYPDAFPGGFRSDSADPSLVYVNLEATFRHRYYEYLTHLFNIQRLKRAQGLATKVEVPYEGYWAQDDWDRSEP